jgi:hypothetical protein
MFKKKKLLETSKRRKEFNVKLGIRGIGLKMWTEFIHPWMRFIVREICSEILKISLIHCVSKMWEFISLVNATRCTSFSNLFYFWNNTLHVSDSLFVHHQESKTVHTAWTVCHTHSADCLLAGKERNCSSISYPLASRQRNLYDIYLLLYVQS